MNDELSKIVESVVKKVVSSQSEENFNGKLTLSLAKKLVAKLEQKAKEIGVNAVIAICDAGARPILVESMDDAFIASYDIALNKAYTVVSLKMSTKKLKTLSQPDGELYGIQFTNNGQIVIFGGGEPLTSGGKVIGGLGVSGGTEEQDTYLASFGKEIFKTLLTK